jgi:hypothetical protein
MPNERMNEEMQQNYSHTTKKVATRNMSGIKYMKFKKEGAGTLRTEQTNLGIKCYN